MTTKRTEISVIKRTLKRDGMWIWPDDPRSPKDKEYIAGYYQAMNATQEKEMFRKRNAAAKLLREEGFQTWTEPRSHIGGTSTVEFALSAMRRK